MLRREVGAHSRALAAQMRSGPTLLKSDRPNHQIVTDKGELSNRRSERQALQAFRIYRTLRLSEIDDPAITFDGAWRRRVEWAFARFSRAFDSLGVADVGVAQ